MTVRLKLSIFLRNSSIIRQIFSKNGIEVEQENAFFVNNNLKSGEEGNTGKKNNYHLQIDDSDKGGGERIKKSPNKLVNRVMSSKITNCTSDKQKVLHGILNILEINHLSKIIHIDSRISLCIY